MSYHILGFLKYRRGFSINYVLMLSNLVFQMLLNHTQLKQPHLNGHDVPARRLVCSTKTGEYAVPVLEYGVNDGAGHVYSDPFF